MYSFCWFLILNLLIWHLAQGEQINWRAHKPKSCVKDDNFSRPNDDPISVYTGISLCAIFDIEESRMEFGIQIFLRSFWKEPMLELHNVNLTRTSVVPDYISDCIWHPDLIFPNAKEATLYDVTLPNRVLKLLKSGYVYEYSRYKILLVCDMVFNIYPMDTQFCTLDIGFLGSRDKEAHLAWQEESKDIVGKNLRIYGTIKPLQFSLKHISVLKETFEYSSGNTTILKVLFEFYRPITASLVNTYVPSFLVVCLSWVSFWLDANAVPGRVTLGVTALLTIATQVVHARSSLPSLSYMTAIDIWLFGCLIMVFSSLIEFTMVQTSFRRNERMGETASWLKTSESNKTISLRSVKKIQIDEHLKQCRPRSVINNAIPVIDGKKDGPIIVTKRDYSLDRLSRIVFPLAMFIFSSIYWSYFLNLSTKAAYTKMT